ncbi:hypothetical protein HZH68_007839 [Vespula germanica]|uniref:Uncharacterized protein n=1 Tax=Vespula germanica TaxID=30212 RepID=A0A834K344_VESGE|nr:hypothetical protein HZH68_007839 [Vespula germanica]
MESSRAETNRAEQNRTEQNRTEQNRAEQSRVEQSRSTRPVYLGDVATLEKRMVRTNVRMKKATNVGT